MDDMRLDLIIANQQTISDNQQLIMAKIERIESDTAQTKTALAYIQNWVQRQH